MKKTEPKKCRKRLSGAWPAEAIGVKRVAQKAVEDVFGNGLGLVGGDKLKKRNQKSPIRRRSSAQKR